MRHFQHTNWFRKIIKNKIEWLILIYVASSRFGGQGNPSFDNLKIDGISKKITYQFWNILLKEKNQIGFFFVRLYCQNNHKWKLPQAADKKLNSQAWNIGMTESYEEIDSSNSLLTVEHHYYLAKGSVTYMWSISRQVYQKVFCFVFQIPTQYVDCRLIYNFVDFESKKHHNVKV